jgi:hypothetical protein
LPDAVDLLAASGHGHLHGQQARTLRSLFLPAGARGAAE